MNHNVHRSDEVLRIICSQLQDRVLTITSNYRLHLRSYGDYFVSETLARRKLVNLYSVAVCVRQIDTTDSLKYAA
jgi:hypothetical protein